jgi:RNA polymerase sigma-70 factor (ECF subfamily)
MAVDEPRPCPARPAAVRAELEQLYSEHGEQVRAICISIVRDRHEAEDAAQQVFVSALRALRSGTVPRDARAWLATIARRESWARARRQRLAALPDGLEDRAQEDPATTVVRQAELAETWQTIAALPASQREAFLLREVRGLGYDELADDLRLSRASVRSLLRRARHRLRLQVERGAGVLAGAQWLDAFTRLFAPASTPALSSATRAAAAGLGAVAIAGSAVVGPALVHHPRARPAVHRTPKPANADRPTAIPVVAPAVVSAHVERRPAAARDSRGADRSGGRMDNRVTRGDRHGGGGSDDRGATVAVAVPLPQTTGGSSGDGSGGGTEPSSGPSAATSGGSTGSDGSRLSPLDLSTTSGSSRDGSGSSDHGETTVTSTTSSGDGSGSSSGHGGSDGSSGSSGSGISGSGS